MPDSPLIAAGAQVQPVSAAPLHTNEFFTGLWTNGNPLGPGAVPYLYSKYWSASRFDRLIGGGNIEVSTHLTLIRRPGCSVYNSSLFPPINRFYEWRGFVNGAQKIRLFVSCDAPGGGPGGGSVRDATGPSTNLVYYNKVANAGRTSFVAVGNHLYWGDGAQTGIVVQSPLIWQPNTLYNPGDFIIDPNNEVQMAVGNNQGNITNIQVDDATVSGHPPQTRVTLWFDFTTPMDVPNNIALRLAGLSTVPGLNGLITSSTVQVISSTQLQFFSTPSVAPVTPFSTETGAASTGTSISGSTPPTTWNETEGLVTLDGSVQWICEGWASLPWGLPTPTVAPTVTLTPVPPRYKQWQPSTWYAPNFYLLDSSAGLQKLVTAGTLGPSQPSWSATPGAITSETSPGTAQWQCITPPGAGAWVANHAYASGYVITVTVTVVSGGVSHLTTVQMVAQSAGTSGASPPSWNAGLGTLTTESTGLTWRNAGTANGWATMGAGAKVSLDQVVVDKNGYLEAIQAFGESGATQPATWANQGGITVDTAATNPATWLNSGPFAPAGVGGSWVYGYSGKDSVGKQVSSMSPASQPISVTVDNMVVVQGPGLPDPPYDKIVIWRTLQGTTTPLYELDEIPNPGAGATWTYYDSTPDQPSATSAGLNTFIQAPINGNNNPPPANFIPQCYYLNRIWGFSGQILMYSNGPDQGAVAGLGDSGFIGLHQFTLQSLGVKCWPTSMGLIVWTQSDVWAVLGQGTYDANGSPISPFYMVQFQDGVGLANQDAFSVNGSTAYAMLSSHQVVSMDPGAGENEVGFPVGDIFDNFFDITKTYLCWHQGRSKDTALYVADGSSYYLRMAATAAPESGTVWSTPAVIAAPGKIQAIASIDLNPGQKALLIGPSVNAQPILMRDLTVNADNTVPYQASALIANVVLAQPGSGVAAVQFVVTEEAMIAGATPVQVQLLFDEIYDPGGKSIILRNMSNDPPNLPPSQTVKVQRLWAAQDADAVVKCRHYQQKLIWPAENFANELFTNTVYGRLPEKARK